MSFQVIPAIDLMGGKVVRLIQGNRRQVTLYPQSPRQVAADFEAAGSRWLHVVSLDGALDLIDQANRRAFKQLSAGPARIQFGGGLRSLSAMQSALESGADRLVLGTLALEQPSLLDKAVNEFGVAGIAVAVDVRNGVLQSHGWTEGVNLDLNNFLNRLQSQAIRHLIYTDAERDGTGRGLALSAAKEIQEVYNFEVIVSGGVGSLADITAARQAGISGVIVGKALHDGRFTMEEALAC